MTQTAIAYLNSLDLTPVETALFALGGAIVAMSLASTSWILISRWFRRATQTDTR